MTNLNNRQVHIFLSSTFADMQSERNHLIKHVFPVLKTRCRKRNIDLNIIDLRWGITEEESKTGKVVEICIDEIDRTRPFFIGLLGGRYGWTPEDTDLFNSSKLQEKHPWIKASVKERKSITEMEMQYGALNSLESTNAIFFIKDESSIPQKFKETDSTKINKLNALKENIINASKSGKCLVENFHSTNDLGDKFYNAIMDLINKLFPEENKNPQAIIDDYQKSEQNNLRKAYVPTRTTMQDLTDLVETDTKRIMIYGKQGSGKSALLANWRKEHTNNKDLSIIRMHVSNQLNTINDCFEYLVFKLKEIYPELNGIDKPGEKANELLSAVHLSGKVIWIIDGVNKCNDEESKTLNWLNNLPKWLTCVISTTDKDLADTFNKSTVLTMPDLSPSEIISFVEAYLKSHAKALSDRQRVHISNYPLFRKPSILTIFLEELLQFGIYEELDNYIEHYLQAPNEEDFINRIIDRYASDYGKEHITKLLYTLSLTYYGLPESSIPEFLQCTNLKWAELYGALSPLLSNIEGYIDIKDSSIKNIIHNKYTVTENEPLSRRSVIDIISNECNKIDKLQRKAYSVSDRILYYLFNLLFKNKSLVIDTEFEYLFDRNQTELIYQLYAIGDFKRLHRFFSKNIFSTTSLKTGIIDNLKIIKDLYANGYQILREQLTTSKTTRLYFLFKNDLPTFELIVTSAIILHKNILEGEMLNEEFSAITKNIKRAILIPKAYRQKLCAQIKGIGQSDGLDYSGNNIEETWIPGKDFDVMETVLYANVIETMFNYDKIKDILEKSIAMTQSNDTITSNLFHLISALCLIRLGRYKEASDFISKVKISDETELLKIRTNIDLLLFSRTNPENKLTSLLEKFASIYEALQVSNHPLKLYSEKYNLANSLQKGDNKAIEKAFHFIHTNYREENKKEIFIIFAEWLFVLRYYKESSVFYKAAIETSNITESEKAVYYSNIGENSRRNGLVPETALYYNLAATIYKSEGKTDNSVSCYIKSTNAYYKIGNYEKCINGAKTILQISNDKSDKAFAHNITALAISHMALENKDKSLIDQAFEEYSNAISLNPNDTIILKNSTTTAIESAKTIGYMPKGIDGLFNQWESLLTEDSDITDFLNLRCEYLYTMGNADEALDLLFNCKQTDVQFTFELIIKLCFASSNPTSMQIAVDFIIENFKQNIISFRKSGNFTELTDFINYISGIADIETVIEQVKISSEKKAETYAFISAYYKSINNTEETSTYLKLWKSALLGSKAIEEVIPFILLRGYSNKADLIKQFFNLAKCQDEDYEILSAISEIKNFDESLTIASNYIAEEISIRKNKVLELDKLLSYVLSDTNSERSVQIISAVSTLIKENGQEICPGGGVFPADTALINKTAYALMTILPTLENGKFDNLLCQCGISDIKPIYYEDFNNTDILVDKYQKISSSGYFDKETILEEYNRPILEALIENEEYEKALILFEEYKDTPTEDLDSSTFIDKAFSLMNCGRYSEALDEWKMLENLYPEEADFLSDIYCKPLCLIYLGKFIDAYKEIEMFERTNEDSYVLTDKIIGITKSICLIEQGLINDGIKFFATSNYQPTEEDLENDPICSKTLNERLCLYHISLCKYYVANGNQEEATKEMKILDSLKAGSFRGIVKIQLDKLSKR